MRLAGYEITDRTGRAVAVMLPDQWRAETAAVQNHGAAHELVRRSDVVALVAAHEAGMAALRAQLGLAPGWQ